MNKIYPYQRRQPAGQQPKADDNPLQKILSNSAVIVTIFTALLYFHGRSLYHGYLTYWGLNTDLFPISTEDALFNGVYTYLQLGLGKWRYLLFPPFLVLYVLLFLLCFKKPFSFVRRIVSTKKLDILTDNQKLIVSDFFPGVQKVFIILLIVFGFLLITAFSLESGKKSANKIYQKLVAGAHDSNNFTETSIVYRDDQDRVTHITGYHIASSTALCAIGTRDGVQVIPFSRIISIQVPKVRSSGPE